MKWSVRRFEHLVEMRRDVDAAALAFSAAHALVRDLRFASYHAAEAEELIQNAVHIPEDDTSGLAALKQLFSEAEPGVRERPLREANFRASAHLLAFFRALHGATDLLAPTVYWGLGLDVMLSRPIGDKNISPSRVYAELTKHGFHPKVTRAWDALLTHRGYQYLRALVNTMKHRQFVKAGFTVSFNFAPKVRHGIQVGGFRYDDTYEPKWASDFIKTEYPTIVRRVVGVGRALNGTLARERFAAA